MCQAVGLQVTTGTRYDKRTSERLANFRRTCARDKGDSHNLPNLNKIATKSFISNNPNVELAVALRVQAIVSLSL